MTSKLYKVILISLMLFLLSTLTILADSNLGNITIYSHINKDDNIVVIEDSFDLYQIADYIDSKYVNKDNFKDYPTYSIEMNGSQTNDLANNLKNYIRNNNINPDYSAQSDSNGYTNFKDLKEGVYLIIQKDSTLKYITNPILISIPYEKDQETYYSFRIDAKYTEDIDDDINTDYVVDTSDNTNLNKWNIILYGSLTILIVISVYYRYEIKRNK